jgi:beta-glucosidase
MAITPGFPEGFLWGVSTAAYQIEGAVDEDGRTPSIWDTFSHTPGAVDNGDTGDVACDHYHRYREDADLIAGLGVGAYRFSLAWPRLQPEGRGALNEAGVDFYSRLIDELLERGVQPWPTLYHWDLPQSLEDEGGWPARDTAARFAEYSAAVYERLSDRVSHWTTLNEPWCSAFLGYCAGAHAPGVRDRAAALRACHHLLLGHGMAVESMRSQGRPESRFGVTLNLHPVSPASEDPADADAARRIDGQQNRIFLDPLFQGRYPADVLEDVADLTDGSHMQPGDDRVIAAPIDFLGVNYYFRHVVRAADSPQAAPLPWVAGDEVEFVERGLPKTAMGWEIDPGGLHEMLARVHREYGVPAIYVTENGAAFADEPPANGVVRDPERVAYLREHLQMAQRAAGEGVPLRGYFVWSLMDNFEWSYGYDRRFGLVRVDYDTLERIPKESGRWFAEVARSNALPAG